MAISSYDAQQQFDENPVHEKKMQKHGTNMIRYHQLLDNVFFSFKKKTQKKHARKKFFFWLGFFVPKKRKQKKSFSFVMRFFDFLPSVISSLIKDYLCVSDQYYLSNQ